MFYILFANLYSNKAQSTLESYEKLPYKEYHGAVKIASFNDLKSSIFSILVLRRIVYLFKRAIAKFKKEKKIWLEFFNFLITHKCSNLLNKEI